jgi:hypothetical protein
MFQYKNTLQNINCAEFLTFNEGICIYPATFSLSGLVKAPFVLDRLYLLSQM